MSKHLFARLRNGTEHDFGPRHAKVVAWCSPIYAAIWVAKIVITHEKAIGIDASTPSALEYELREP